jgi:hypothetical protein
VVNDAVRLVGAGKLDVAFLPEGSAQAQALERVGLRIDLPAPVEDDAPIRLSDTSARPDTPPRLR